MDDDLRRILDTLVPDDREKLLDALSGTQKAEETLGSWDVSTDEVTRSTVVSRMPSDTDEGTITLPPPDASPAPVTRCSRNAPSRSASWLAIHG